MIDTPPTLRHSVHIAYTFRDEDQVQRFARTILTDIVDIQSVEQIQQIERILGEQLPGASEIVVLSWQRLDL